MSRPSDQVLSVYGRHALAWTRARGAEPLERSWLDRFAGRLPSGGSVLDLGCGSGAPIARELSERGFTVTGVDGAPEMIDLFRAALPTRRAYVADMRELALAERFGGVIAWDSFFHLTPEDQRGMFRVFAAHADRGAPLMFTSGPEAGEVVGLLEGEPLYHASLDPDEYRTLLSDAGFEVLAHARKDPACGGRTVWLARKT